MTEEQHKSEEEEGDSNKPTQELIKEEPKEDVKVEGESPLAKAEAILQEITKKESMLKKQNDRTEKIMAENMVAGQSLAGQPQKKIKLTEIQYAEALQRGEVDPFKADGIEGY